MKYSMLLTEKEINEIKKVSFNKQKDYLIISLITDHGLYGTELKLIKKNNLNILDGMLQVGNKKNQRIITLSKELLTIFEEYVNILDNTQEYLFQTNFNNPLNQTFILRILKKYCKKAGINKPVTPKLLRLALIHLRYLKNPQCWEELRLEFGHCSYLQTKKFFFENMNS